MKSIVHKCLFVIINIAVVLIFVKPAHAYLDPGTISYFLQILIASLVGISVTIKLCWSSIVSFFKRENKTGNDSASIKCDIDKINNETANSAIIPPAEEKADNKNSRGDCCGCGCENKMNGPDDNNNKG